MLVFSVISFPVIYISAKILSLFYYNPRPFVSNSLIPLISHSPDNGFTSDHTLLASAIAAAIFYFDRKAGMLFFTLAIIIGIARIVAGVHHLVDILGSFAIVFIVSFLINRYLLPKVMNLKYIKGAE